MELKQRLHALLVRELGVDQDKIVDEARLDRELGADNIDIISIAMELEDEFGVTLTDDQVEELNTETVGRLAAMIAVELATPKSEAA